MSGNQKTARVTTGDNIGKTWSGKPLPKIKYEDMITELRPGQIIVIGSNERGVHGAGAALYAHMHFGLKWGVGEGLSGQTYALPTMTGLEDMAAAALRFIDYATLSHDLTFLLTKVGCGIAGYPEKEVKALFLSAPVNVIRPTGWPAFKPFTETEKAPT